MSHANTGPTWQLSCWKGPVAVIEPAVRQLGWFGPGETTGSTVDARIGGFLRESGRPLMVLDGVAYAMVVATETLPPPDGAELVGRDHALALIGTF